VLDANRTRLCEVITTFDFSCFDLIVTTMVLRFQALKEKEDSVVEMLPPRPLPEILHEIAVDVEVANITNENLATSEGQDAAETVSSAAPNDTEQENRAKV
jgi:hypothetical protein